MLLGSRIAVLQGPIVVAAAVKAVVAVAVVVAVALAAVVVGPSSGHLKTCWGHPETKTQPTAT